jgi:hypothetical protein
MNPAIKDFLMSIVFAICFLVWVWGSVAVWNLYKAYEDLQTFKVLVAQDGADIEKLRWEVETLRKELEARRKP